MSHSLTELNMKRLSRIHFCHSCRRLSPNANVFFPDRHDLTETTREMIKRGTDSLKELATLQSQLPHQAALLKKTSHDFQLSVAAFQNAQRLSAERQRTVVEVVKQTAGDENAGSSSAQAEGQMQTSPTLQQTQIQIQQVSSFVGSLNEIFNDF